MKIGRKMQSEKGTKGLNYNKGVSLVEIIIVIAIIAIFASSALGGIHYIQYADSKKCATEIDAAIDKARIKAMSQANHPSLYLYQYHNIYYLREIGTDVADPSSQLDDTGVRLANQQLKLYYRTSNMNPTDPDNLIRETPSPSIVVKLRFIKSTGGIASIAGTNYYNQILIKDNNGVLKYTITLIQATGKHFISKNS